MLKMDLLNEEKNEGEKGQGIFLTVSFPPSSVKIYYGIGYGVDVPPFIYAILPELTILLTMGVGMR